jgi:N-methylhydantoinase A/oxoprolinase/acetone carboxylase beta subunit
LTRMEGRLHRRPTPDHVEYWFFQREPRRFIADEKAREVLHLLKERPYSLPELLERIGLFHPLQFSGPMLIQEEFIGRAGLTPTDLLHLTGDYAPWSVNAAQIAASIVARLNETTVDDLIAGAMRVITERITGEIVSFISGQTLARPASYGPFDNLGGWLFEESLYHRHPYLGSQISLKMPIIGIGAPAGIFLPRVAELLQTELILPEHHEVANAIGAAAGSVMISEEAWVLPRMRGQYVSGYYVRVGAERQFVSDPDAALETARQEARQRVEAGALSAGAADPQVTFEVITSGPNTLRVRARAIGSPRLSVPR